MEATPKNEDISAIYHSTHRGHTRFVCQIHLSTSVSIPRSWQWQSHYSASSISDKAAGNLSLLRLAGYHCFS